MLPPGHCALKTQKAAQPCASFVILFGGHERIISANMLANETVGRHLARYRPFQTSLDGEGSRGVAAESRAEQFPVFACEPHHL